MLSNREKEAFIVAYFTGYMEAEILKGETRERARDRMTTAVCRIFADLGFDDLSDKRVDELVAFAKEHNRIIQDLRYT